MKKYEHSHTANEALDQQSHSLPKKYFASVFGTKENKLLKEIVQNPKNNSQTAVQTNSSFCSNGVESDNKRSNELGALALAVNYCLNTQSKIADALSEIGQYLKILNDDSNHANAQDFRKQKQNVLSPSVSTIVASGRVSGKQVDGLLKKQTLQAIVGKIEILQREINAKIRDFDSRLQGSEGRNGNNLTGISLPTEDIYFGRNPKLSPQKTTKSPLTQIISAETVSQKSYRAEPSSSQERVSNFPVDFHQKRRETMPDETLNLSKNNFDIQSIENSHIVNLNLSNLGVQPVKKQKASAQKKNAASKLQLNLAGFKNARDGNTSPVSIQSYAEKNYLNKPVAIKLDLHYGSTKNLHEPMTRQLSQKKLGKVVAERKDYSRVQSKIKTRESASLDRKEKAAEKKNFLAARRGTTANVNVAKEAGFISLKSSPREFQFEFGIRKSSTKPDLNIVPPKEIIDDGAPDHTVDQTMQKDDSILSGEDTPQANDLGKSMNLDTERVYEPEEVDDLMQNPTQSFVKNTAKKEKMIIKTLMRDQYDGAEISSYQKANHGQVYQKKCLINARWWRAWKDFVNFDAGDTGAKTGQLLEMGLYPRPGSINNRELIKQEVLLDLGNLTPELELKENLLEHHDYEAVSKKVYDVLAKWYGFDFEICRVLRPDPFRENKSYLELYPKKKPAGKANQTSLDTRNSNSSTIINSIINSNLSQTPV